MFCPDCGKKIKETGQKFCEKCGAELSSEEIEEIQENSKEDKFERYEEYIANLDLHKKEKIEKTEVKREVSEKTEVKREVSEKSLLDLDRDYYIIKEKMWDWGSGDIYDEKGLIIGRMHRKIFNIRRKVDLMEPNGTIVASIHHKLISARSAQDIMDSDDNIIARIKRKILAPIHPKFYLEDPSGKRWYEAKGKFMGWSFKIYEVETGKVIAEIEKADRWRDIFFGGFLDFQDTYALKILEHETDRRILLGFVLTIDNVLHDQHGMGFMPWGSWGHRHRNPRGQSHGRPRSGPRAPFLRRF